MTQQALLQSIIKNAYPARGIITDYRPLIDRIGKSRIVLIGEASHGTHEFYQARADITKLLIEEKGFSAVAIEGDWPAVYNINQYVHQNASIKTAAEALSEFKRFPAWMWRNTVITDFISWLKAHNAAVENQQQVSFFGLDLYSLHLSIEVVINYISSIDPIAGQQAKERYSCFDHFGKDPQMYGYWASLQESASCKSRVIAQLQALRKHAFQYITDDSNALDAFFNAEQNAVLIKNAEHYYRSLFEQDHSWNIRDQHMMETLQAIAHHLEAQGRNAKIVVWAHNSHLGDARATEMSSRGELNLGQLVKEKYGDDSFSVGFTTYSGTVSAASDWGGDVERKHVRPALEGSYEDLFHQTHLKNFMLFTNESSLPDEWRLKERLERAIGVIYRPQTERMSHYFFALMHQQFDAIIHFDKTQALEPLERNSVWEQGEFPDTYPSGE